jgi:hypothetical protein
MHTPAMLRSLIAFAVLAVVPAAAELAVTSPIATTVCRGGETCQVQWKDDQKGVTLAQQGLCTIALYAGGRFQQTRLQAIAFPTPVNVATAPLSIDFVVDPTVGQDSSDYFIRFDSTTLRQGNSTTGAPYLSFSAKFKIEGMTGTFNQTILDQIAGTASASAPAASATASGSAGATTPRAGATTTTRVSSTNTPGSANRNSAFGAAAGAVALAGFAALF